MKTKNYINYIKVLAMLFVVCMHVISKAMPNYEYTSNTYHILLFLDILLRTSVPLFIMVSGNLLLNKDYSIKDVFKRILKYYVLFILFNSLYYFVDLVILQHQLINFNVIKDVLIDGLLLKSIYQMWYFKLILLTYASLPILRLIIKRDNKYIDVSILLVLFSVFFLIPLFNSSINYYLCFIFYFYLGYFLKKYSFKYESLLLIIPFIVSYYLIFTKSMVLDHDYIYFSFDYIPMMLLPTFIFSLFVSLDIYLKSERINDLFKKLAQYSFYIFIFHGLVIGILSKINIINIYSYNNLIMILVNTIIVYICTLLLSIILKFINDKLIKVCKNIIK